MQTQATPAGADPCQATPATEALLRRARAGMLASVVLTDHIRDNFDFWQGYAKALNDLRRGAGAKLAAKDLAQPYELPSVLSAAAQVLDHDIERLSRREIEQRLTEAGIKLPPDAEPLLQVAAVHQLKDGAVAGVDLHDEHAVALVQLYECAGLHGGDPVMVAGADIVDEGGAA
ncbi:MAG: hypothetical protein ACRECD_14005 [Burkholderiaceae bacterium]